MCCVHLYTINISFLYIHLLLYIDNILLLVLASLYLSTSLAHILHLFVLFLLDMLVVHNIHHFYLFFCLVLFHKFLISPLHDTILVLFLYILHVLILPTMSLILFLYCLLYNSLSFLFLRLYAHLDDDVDVLIYLLNFLNFHHIFFSIYKLFFYILQT